VKDRRAEMVEGLRKAQAIRDRLAELERPAETYPENHSTRLLLESLGLHRARSVVEGTSARSGALSAPEVREHGAESAAARPWWRAFFGL
jgi:hypothetical protein